MTELIRLIELLQEVQLKCDDNYGMTNTAQMADYLLKNGVIVLPVKVGDTVYINGKAAKVSIIHIEHDMKFCIVVDCFGEVCDDCEYCCFAGTDNCYYGYFEFTADDIGKTVFLTREEAEKALKEREQNV